MNTPIYFFASSVGGATIDQDKEGGNPFASALVELLARNHLTLVGLVEGLADLTVRKSGGYQRPELPVAANLPNWLMLPGASTELRIALVLVFSDYSASGGGSSLPGAKHDAQRVGTMLEQAGFETQIFIDPERQCMRDILQAFASRSSSADVSLIYTTGHGAHVAGITYLLPGDYPIWEGNLSLENKALKVSELAAVSHARRMNLVFYGGCRNDPFSRP